MNSFKKVKLVVCPLERELNLLIKSLTEFGFEAVPVPGARLSLTRVDSLGLLLARGGHGKAQFGIHTQYLLSHHGPIESVFCVGVAGGLCPQLKIGDIVVGENSIEYDYLEKFSPHGNTPKFVANAQLLKDILDVDGDFGFSLHVGDIASGDEDIVESTRAQALYIETGALAVAWEGSGGARASQFNKVPYVEIRSISDNAREHVVDSFEKHLSLCMANMAQFLIALMRES